MTTLTQDIKDKLTNLNVLEKIIAINVVVFLLALILRTDLIWFELPSSFSSFIMKPWSIISYAFLHYDVWHILFNMLWLYFLGRMFLNLFSAKMAINIYFLGAISGGLLFMFCYSLFPGVFGGSSRLLGASAAVRALLIFLCAYMPNQEMRFFTFSLKLWYVGAAIVALDVIGVFSGIKDPVYGNAGGNLAHLGGALLGYFYAKQLLSGNDIGKGFERMTDSVVSMFKPSKKGPLKTVHKNKGKVGGYTKADFNAFNNQKKIDVILDKISKSGYDSLTSEEKEFLFRAGK
ncbi:rhomboid family intramembrane serine protease [Algibacter amylolyticus]|uniref:Rhomboid family intramembrane serine protease n=1 Tax=Algibacter amylolyticus TaxID=1608400 RepID=A0A5M7BA39_9FLAO|nr:rhomboid family intramembrane serine protease [Algibacter amylolyticus]KAA5825107.1 rhomboid family intramembrane serine protease [Algibacter amylolyticus]MBB5268786.1 membrane associated rhomboid family serine protease [Algibacter amylolyticus]TSJ77601.1 rhomboid family intramembrane serine protease [Algibacter amylolyticus]